MLTGAGLHCSDVDDVRQCLAAPPKTTAISACLADAPSAWDFRRHHRDGPPGTLDYD